MNQWSFVFFIPATMTDFGGFSRMFSTKQGNYWYHFYNVCGMTRSLTGDWTRDIPHSKPALYHLTIEEAVMTSVTHTYLTIQLLEAPTKLWETVFGQFLPFPFRKSVFFCNSVSLLYDLFAINCLNTHLVAQINTLTKTANCQHICFHDYVNMS